MYKSRQAAFNAANRSRYHVFHNGGYHGPATKAEYERALAASKANGEPYLRGYRVMEKEERAKAWFQQRIGWWLQDYQTYPPDQMNLPVYNTAD